MIDVILHIGRHKTGTSSLQVFLDRNTELLNEHGYIYPRMIYRGNAHHPLGESLKRSITDRMSVPEIRELTHHYRRKIVRRFLHKRKKLIFSSESFQNCDPKVIRQVFNSERFNVKVICYFRDQVSYYCSAYNQKVHANIFSADVADFGFDGDYISFTDEWTAEFDHLECRVFDRSQLYKGDVVTDFCHHVLGIQASLPDKEQSNPSLTNRLLAFKLLLNKKSQTGEISIKLSDKQIYRRLSQMCLNDDSGRYKLPQNLADSIIQKYQGRNFTFSKKYLKDIALVFPQPTSSPEIEYLLTEEEFAEIYSKLIS